MQRITWRDLHCSYWIMQLVLICCETTVNVRFFYCFPSVENRNPVWAKISHPAENLMLCLEKKVPTDWNTNTFVKKTYIIVLLKVLNQNRAQNTKVIQNKNIFSPNQIRSKNVKPPRLSPLTSNFLILTSEKLWSRKSHVWFHCLTVWHIYSWSRTSFKVRCLHWVRKNALATRCQCKLKTSFCCSFILKHLTGETGVE